MWLFGRYPFLGVGGCLLLHTPPLLGLAYTADSKCGLKNALCFPIKPKEGTNRSWAKYVSTTDPRLPFKENHRRLFNQYCSYSGIFKQEVGPIPTQRNPQPTWCLDLCGQAVREWRSGAGSALKGLGFLPLALVQTAMYLSEPH